MHPARWILGLCIVAATAATGCHTPSGGAGPAASAHDASLPPVDPAKPRVRLATNLGDIVVDLDGKAAPCTTANFVRYVREGYYTGTLFHRVMKDYLIQGGGYAPGMDVKSEGVHEPVKLESNNGLSNVRGTIAMARGNLPDSATTQFFINLTDNSHRLNFSPGRTDPGHAVFGTVVSGMETADKIARVPVGPNEKFGAGRLAVVPIEDVVIESATLLNPDSVAPIRAVCDELMKPAAPPVDQDELIAAFRRKTEEKTGLKFQKTERGIEYIDVRTGRGPIPTVDDRIVMHYIGRLADGKVIENSYKLTEPRTYEVRRLVEGLQDAVTSMNVGGLRTVIIPPDLAYKDVGIPRGNPPLIPPDAWLTYDIELLDIR